MDGQKFYIGKGMVDVHKNLGITDEAFDKACEIFAASVKKTKPKLKVMIQFVKRIGSLRNQIVFPPVPQDNQEEVGDNNVEVSLFKRLGQETGIRNIVEIVFELAKEDEV